MANHSVRLQVTGIDEAVVQGNDYTFTLTLARDDNASAALDGTLTASIVSKRDPGTEILSDLELTITDANARTATLSLTDVQTALLDAPADYEMGIAHLFDVKNVEAGGSVVHYGPVKFPVRRSIT